MTFRRSPTLDLAEQITMAREAGRDLISLSTPSFPELDFSKLPWINGCNQLTPAEGSPELRKLARAIFFSRWNLPDHDLLIAAGAKLALFSAVKSLLPENSQVLVVTPAWPSYADFIEMAGHTPAYLATEFDDGFAIRRPAVDAAMRKSAAAAIVLSNPGNPTGRVYSSQELDILLTAAEENNAYLMLDESFSQFHFDEDQWVASSTRSSKKLVLFNSFSKNFYLQGLRVAACMAHTDAIKSIVAAHQTLISSAPSASQAITLALLQSQRKAPSPDDYRESRAIAEQIINDAGWTAVPNSGTFYFFPRINHPEQTFEKLRNADMYPLEGSTFGEAYGSHLRFCFGKPAEEMREIQRRMASIGLLT